MTVETSPSVVESPEPQPATATPPKRIERQVAERLLALLPGTLVVYFSFNAGGYFPSSVGFATLLVIQMIVLLVLVSDRPFAGYTRALAIVATLFAAYSGWILASQIWSHTEDRALIEFDRALLYLSLLVLFGLVPRPQWRMVWMIRGLAAGVLFVCACALVTRLLPDVWSASAVLAKERLSFPLTYWNALGILASVGVILTLGIAANPNENRFVRAAAAGAVPILATTLFFTFSRGAIIALIAGLVAYLAVSHSSALVGALLTTVPTTVIALVVAYNADLLATTDPTTPAAMDQGKRVALVLLACVIGAVITRLATMRLDRRLAERKRHPWPRRKVWTAVGATTAVIVIAAVLAGAPSWVSDQYDGFFRAAPAASGDLRARLFDPSSSGRTEHWRVAFEGFSDDVFTGQGAGTYQFTWNRDRRQTFTVVDGHGLYFEVLSELGLPGLLLLVATILGLLLALLGRVHGPNRMIYAAFFGATVAWAVHAGVDWDWEMPAVTAWVFAVGGASLAVRGAHIPRTGNRGRIPIAAALLLVAVTPALLMLSQFRLEASANAFERADCKRASSEAIASINFLAIRPEPYQIIGYCDLADGRADDAVAAMRKAVDQQPESWEFHFSLGIAQAYAGVDPRRQVAEASRLNPREPLVRQATAAFRDSSPSTWVRESEILQEAARSSGLLTLR